MVLYIVGILSQQKNFLELYILPYRRRKYVLKNLKIAFLLLSISGPDKEFKESSFFI